MIRGAIYGILAASIWGGLYVVSDVVLDTIPPFSLLTLRLFLGCLTLSLIYLFVSDKTMLTSRQWARILLIGVVGFGISLGAQFVGTAKSNAINGALITSTSPVFIVLFAAIILHESITARKIIALLLALVGVIIILNLEQVDLHSDAFVGNLFLILAAITWGVYSVLIRKVSNETKVDTLIVTIGASIGGLLFAIPASMLELSHNPVGEITSGVVFGVLYLGVVATALAAWMWNRSFALVPASIASLFFFAQPLSGAILSVMLLSQPLTVNLLVGAGFILSGVLLSLRRRV